MGFKTDFTISQAYHFNPELVKGSPGSPIYYAGVLVDSGTSKVITPGAIVEGVELNYIQALSLWQQCYLYISRPKNADLCADVVCQMTNTCLNCRGDGHVSKWYRVPETKEPQPIRVVCPQCKGTGKINYSNSDLANGPIPDPEARE